MPTSVIACTTKRTLRSMKRNFESIPPRKLYAQIVWILSFWAFFSLTLEEITPFSFGPPFFSLLPPPTSLNLQECQSTCRSMTKNSTFLWSFKTWCPTDLVDLTKMGKHQNTCKFSKAPEWSLSYAVLQFVLQGGILVIFGKQFGYIFWVLA